MPFNCEQSLFFFPLSCAPHSSFTSFRELPTARSRLSAHGCFECCWHYSKPKHDHDNGAAARNRGHRANHVQLVFFARLFFFFVVEFSGRSKLHLGRSARNYVEVFFRNAQCTDLKFRQNVAVVVVTVVVAAITVVVVAAVVGVAHASQIVVSNGIPTPKLKTNAR